MISQSLLFSFIALAALIPAAVAPNVRGYQMPVAKDATFWLLLGVALAGPALWVFIQFADAWRTGVAAALWLSIVMSLILYIVVAAVSRTAWRLAPVLLAYLFLLGVLATLWQHAPERPLLASMPSAWLEAHILLSIGAYGLLTLSAVAGCGVFLQERALKLKHPTSFTRQLPSIADGEALQVSMLVVSEAVLALALITGMTMEWLERRALLRFDHKTVLSLATFVVIAGLLWLHQRGGLHGRKGARYVLFAYLLLTLAYPGVKFVTDVLVG
jgi:ABC-type uncharacterized transport system permease subunit